MKRRTADRHQEDLSQRLKEHAALFIVGLLVALAIVSFILAPNEHINTYIFLALAAVFLLIWLGTRKP